MLKPTATNTDRVSRIASIASIAHAYRPISGDSPQDFATDLLPTCCITAQPKGCGSAQL
jgi:hypothetical protein